MKHDLEYVVRTEDVGMTVRGIARLRLGVSRRLMRRISNASDGVFLCGRSARFTDRVKEGDLVGLDYPEEASGFVPQDIPIDVIYEDDDILIVNKQPGLVVHPTKGHSDGTIANGLMRRMEGRGERYKIRFMNRLDMDTSGILLVGKNAHAQSEFARQSEIGGTRKLYFAVLDGAPMADSGIVEAPIALAEEGSPRRAVREDGAPSRTFYRILERYSYREAQADVGEDAADGDAGVLDCDGVFASAGGASGDAAFALISIATGRTHQIRVHMEHIGCPVMGDSLYGRNAPTLPGADAPLIGRQALHAAMLRFAHPRTREEFTAAAPPPADFAGCVQTLRHSPQF